MPTPIRGQSITAPPKVDATLSNTSSNTVQNQAVANALAGAYDATATYAVGDLCIYDGILYECTTAITTAEAWDATHWKTGNFGEKVSDLNRQLSDVDENQIPELKNAISQNAEAVADTQSMIATVEATTTASKNYSVGDLLVYDGKLYEVTSAIATGATITVGTNVTQTTVETQIASGGGGGGTGFPAWNHQYFEITSEAERKQYFEIVNNQDVNEFYVYGEVYFDAYDGVAVHSDNTPLHGNTVSVSATKKFFEIRLWKSGPSYIGLGCVSEWNTQSGTLTFLNVYMQKESAFGNIRIGSYWNNKTMLEGTKVHVWWR